jgi:hypothetical protein
MLVLGAISANDELMQCLTIGLHSLIPQAFGIVTFILFLRFP